MPFISNISESANRFGYHSNQQHDSETDLAMALTKSSSSPDLSLKSAARDNFLIQSSYCKNKTSKSEDGDTLSFSGARSFEFREDPSFWKEHNVQVIIRLRPLSSSEVSLQGHSRCVKQESSQSITWTGHPETRFTFDLVADETVSQEMLFKVAGVPMVENCMEGYNSCMFAYGQTGSGKTHTMLGDIEGGARRHSVNCGMTPRVFEYLFSRIQKEKDARREEKLKFTCKCSFLEIYNEQILDLLDPSSANLQIREDTKKGIYVESLTEVEVLSARDVIQQLIQGAANRKVAATNMNRASSRSHSVFTCVIESKWESQGVTRHRFARLNLVDLAGSERQKSSGAEGERLKEATNINKSLSTLGLVIMNLVSISNGKSLHVPYRDSKLTFLLQDSLGGNAKTIIIANISPSSSCSLETLSTLKFAQRAKFIKNHAIINEDASGDVLALKHENLNLKKEISRLRSLVNGGAEGHETDVLSVTFPGSPGNFKWEGFHGFSSPLISEKKMGHVQKKEYEVALVGSFRREKDKDAALQALGEENQAALQLAKQREDEIQGLKMRLRFREAGLKRLEAVASGKISAEIHLLKEKEEHLKEIEVLRAQVDRNQEVTRFAMENLRLKEEIRRLKSFCEDGEREKMNEQITVLQNKLLEALDWKLMHESDPAITQKESADLLVDSQSNCNFLSPNQKSASPWRTSMNEENEFLRLQAIQNQSELDSLRMKLDLCIEEKEKLERHVNDLIKELEAERSSKEAIAKLAQKQQTELPTQMNDHIKNIGHSDQIEIETMVDAIAAASQREAEAHEMAVFLSKENDELRTKLKVLIEDNNKLIDLYERAVADNKKQINDSSLNNVEDSIEDHGHCFIKAAENRQLEMKAEIDSLKHQLMEMHEENDKLLTLYEIAMQEKDEFKRVIASGHRETVEKSAELNCPEKLVEIDGGQCLQFSEASVPNDAELSEEVGPVGLDPQNHNNILDFDDLSVPNTESLLEETCLYEVPVAAIDHDGCSIVSETSHLPDSSGIDDRSLAEVGKIDMSEPIEPDSMEIDVIQQDEINKLLENASADYPRNTDMIPAAEMNLKMKENLNSVRSRLVETQEKISYSARAINMLGLLERTILEVDEISEKIDELEHGIQAKREESAHLKSMSSEMQQRRELANKKLLAVKNSLTSFCSSIDYFEQREALAESRLDSSLQHLMRKKEELVCLQLTRDVIRDAFLRIRQTETELRSCLEDLRSKMDEENRKLESDRVLFAIDNVEKTTSGLARRNWQVSGKATELLKSEEEKTKLQNQIKLNKEKLVNIRKQAEAVNRKLSKLDSEIQVREKELQKEMSSVEDMDRKFQGIVQEKEMLLEMKENGRKELEAMVIEFYQRLFEAELKDEETKMMDEELVIESEKLEALLRAKAEATRKKTLLLETMPCGSCFVSDKVEADLHNIQKSVEELNCLLEDFCSVDC